MLNIALLNKAENIGLASNALHLMLVFVTTPIFLYKVSEWPLILFLYFRRSYKGTLPSLVTSSYPVRKFSVNDYHYDKNCVLHIMLTFAMTHIF